MKKCLSLLIAAVITLIITSTTYADLYAFKPCDASGDDSLRYEARKINSDIDKIWYTKSCIYILNVLDTKPLPTTYASISKEENGNITPLVICEGYLQGGIAVWKKSCGANLR